MQIQRKPLLALIGLGLAIFLGLGLGLGGVSWLASQLEETVQDQQLTALVKWGNPPALDPVLVDMFAAYDLVAFSWGAWDTPAMQAAQDEIRRQNLDALLGCYVSAFTIPGWTIQDLERGGTGWGARWAQALLPFVAFTADGDTAAVFKDNAVFNVLDPRARAAAAELIGQHVRACRLDWIMLDFVSVPLASFQIPGYPVREPDLNGNGIACKVDPLEKEQLRQAWFDYLREIHEACPQDLAIIVNGSLALVDPAFSLMVEGAYVENFPAWFYADRGANPDAFNFRNALNPEFGPQALPRLADPRRWRDPNRFFVLIEDAYGVGTYGYLAALFDGVVELRRSPNDVTYPAFPRDLSSLGRAVGPARFEPGSVSREFEGGSLTVIPNGGRFDSQLVAR